MLFNMVKPLLSVLIALTVNEEKLEFIVNLCPVQRVGWV